ncbi:dTDP-L-rhamnose 4-epimerase [Geobacter sp. OR-1]|uniref:NAD-dependent epimerase/dehydratase family protein n=1 Tax=Geobacter sp. OR-1 TaxID=1266765 RepID=UPI000543BD2A|nr:NAD-dependent epimerase/dehydratase family protein [Geobacter sp. OR-1]GAM08240.1 dTDP-L-rhamnose 4-epimerase [Geobacter sp. OR-1]
MNVLITGGAGFIGTHLTRKLLMEQCTVTLLDNFSPQVHGQCNNLQAEIAGRVRLIRGDVRDKLLVSDALKGQDVVVHLAAETGTGQSMYEIGRYTEVNLDGTAVLFDCLVNGSYSVGKVVVASSRAIYGEGKYSCSEHGPVFPGPRIIEDLANGQFEPRCHLCRHPITALPTDESAPYAPSSYYGLTKQFQEQMVLMFSQSLGISGYALRYQNVYGPGQSLLNPYTGILAIFSNLARTGKPIRIFEDGLESRDFVFIDDVVEATWRCIRPENKAVTAVNVGSGLQTTVLDVAHEIVEFFSSSSKIEITGEFRVGDIRHNLADLRKSHAEIGYVPCWKFREGVQAFLRWTEQQAIETDLYEASLQEMRAKGLMHGKG